jgi:N-acetyl-anhydromuramyl-L-alanine amidase AmpD
MVQILQPTPRRVINLIVIHCSATPNGRPVTAADVDGWHYTRGFRRSMDWRRRQNMNLAAIGYHFLIRVSGAVENGRHLDEIGAHVYGYNRASLGVCIAGTDRFTPAQWDSLKANLTLLLERYPKARVRGHRDLSPDVDGDGIIEKWEWLKTCPGFSVADWLKADMTAPPDAVLEIPAENA